MIRTPEGRPTQKMVKEKVDAECDPASAGRDQRWSEA
jgi:hypothetical protein